MDELPKGCFGKYKIFISHEHCHCDVCLAREDCVVERDRKRKEFLEKHKSVRE